MNDSTALDPTLKASLESWWVNMQVHGWKVACPTCGATGQKREAAEFTPTIVTMKCLLCGHLHFHDLELLKQRAGIR